MILRSILHDSENLMSLAVDAAAYYEKNYRDTGYLAGCGRNLDICWIAQDAVALFKNIFIIDLLAGVAFHDKIFADCIKQPCRIAVVWKNACIT